MEGKFANFIDFLGPNLANSPAGLCIEMVTI